MFNRKLCHPSPYQQQPWVIYWLRNRTCHVEPCLSTVKDSPKVRAPEIGFLNCRSTWQSCLLDKAFFSPPINEKGLLVTRKLCSTLSFLFHCAKWSFPCWLDDYYGQRWRLLPVSGQSMLMLESLFPPPIPGKIKYNLCCILYFSWILLL